MNKNEMVSQYNEREIDLIEVLWDIVYSWRALIIVALVGVIVLAGWQVRRNLNNNKQAQDEYDIQKQAMEENADNQNLPELDETRLGYVSDALYWYKNYCEEKDYLENAPYYNRDLYDINTYVIQYKLKGGSSDKTDVDGLYAVISQFITSSDFYNAIENEVKLGWKDSYYRDLISVDYVSGFTTVDQNKKDDDVIVYLYVSADTKDNADKIVKAVEKLIAKKTQEIKTEFGAFSMQKLSMTVQNSSDLDAVRDKRNLVDEINGLKIRYEEMKANFDADQLKYWQMSLSQNVSVVTEPTLELVPVKAGVVKKALIGFMLGIFLVCCYVGLVAVFKASPKKAADITQLYGVEILGDFERVKKERKNAFDKWLDKLRYPNAPTEEEEAKLLIARVRAALKSNDIKKVIVTGSRVFEGKQVGVYESIASELKKDGIEMISFDHFLFNAEAMEKILEQDGVVLMEEANKSRYKDIADELVYFAERNKKVAGVVFF